MSFVLLILWIIDIYIQLILDFFFEENKTKKQNQQQPKIFFKKNLIGSNYLMLTCKPIVV